MSIQHHTDPITSKRPQSLTPQRKHRKLLKDGTGGEVWPEHIEQLFVQGLRAYWQSPWATYSRGRSRWRNQFLVDYLEKAGISRTKKQVASHIQVLRNMWKTEAELQLVGTGEELFQDSGLLAAVKREELGCLDYDDSMSSGSSPSFSPGDFPSEALPSPTQNHSPMFKTEAYSPTTMLSFPAQSVCSSPSSSNWESSGLPTSPPISGAFPLPSTATAQPLHSKYSPSRVDPSARPASRSATFPSAQTQYVSSNSNRPTTFTLRAEGMTPLVINLDALFPTRSRRTAPGLKIRLSVPTTDDIRSSPQLYGFGASLSLASVWQLSARCTTRAFYANSCVSESTLALDPTLIQGGTAHANLPESPLTQCRMFDPSTQTSLSQEIVVDNEPMLYVLYELERRTHMGLPSAELLGYQEFPMQKSGRSTPRSTSTPNPYAHYSRHPQQAFVNASSPAPFMSSQVATF